jgi:hypothetical protein
MQLAEGVRGLNIEVRVMRLGDQPVWWRVVTAGVLLWAVVVWGGNGALELRDGYFWDPMEGDWLIPRGIAYQTFNPPVGANQTVEQVRYDLAEIKRLRCNSVRCEMVWSQVEPAPGRYDWERPDAMVEAAEVLGLKLFVLIGFQYPPDWFPREWRATDETGAMSDMLAYEHPEARRTYERYIEAVTGRYRNSTAVGAWILGNEYAYFDLWNTDRVFVGYDPNSLVSFRRYLSEQYAGEIVALNDCWGTAWKTFAEVPMPGRYPDDRLSGAHHDLIRWRERSVGDYVAVGARAARRADPNHLISYSMIGAVFIGDDAIYTCEDAATIVARCRAWGAPLDFWSINNYSWTTMNTESLTADVGIRKHLHQSGLPVLITETGHSSTDTYLGAAAARQAEALPARMWEALMSGAIGVHLFTWQDREMYGGWFERERGFGILNQNRTPKVPAYENVAGVFQRMAEVQVEKLFVGSIAPEPRLWLFWGEAAKMGWPRANHEHVMLWHALKRLGFQPGFLNDEEFESGAYLERADALILSRCSQMDSAHLDRVRSEVVGRGVHVLANADLPGQYDAYHRINPVWGQAMEELFGLRVTHAQPWDSGARNTAYRLLELTAVADLDPVAAGFQDRIQTWRIWHGTEAVAGTTVATHRGLDSRWPVSPAVQIHEVGAAKTAAITFALTDLWPEPDQEELTHGWDHRQRWLSALLRTHFGLRPPIELSGFGSSYVIPDYCYAPNGSLLVSLLNGHTESAAITVRAPSLLEGLTIENLTRGGILQVLPDGAVELFLRGDEYVLLHAYRREPDADHSRLNSNPNKLWFESVPDAVWPSARPAVLEVGWDTVEPLELLTVFERVSFPPARVVQSDPIRVEGRAWGRFELLVPGADLGVRSYRSTPEGGEYQWKAILRKGALELASVAVPTQLFWGIRPVVSLPETVVGGMGYRVALKWEQLPGYELAEVGLPLDRAALWEEPLTGWQHYLVLLELLDPAGRRLATAHHLTRSGTGTVTLEVAVPSNYSGAVHWLAYLRPQRGASFDHFDRFENRGPGADPDWLKPWVPYVYSETGTAEYLDGGVGRDDYAEPQHGFVVVDNPPTVGAWSGFGLSWGFPYEVALPEDLDEWEGIEFSARVREVGQLPCVLELQLNDVEGGQLQYTNLYVPGSDGWGRIAATLDQFQITSYPPFTGVFNLARVSSMGVSIRMLETGRVYVGCFDEVRLSGPENDRPPVHFRAVRESFENRALGDDPALPEPWLGYVYSETGKSEFIAQGIHPIARHGLRSAFLAATNSPTPGKYAGMGFLYEFPEPWVLPARASNRSPYRFGFDFRESTGLPCRIELQVKSGPMSWIEFGKDYAPDADGWDRVEASLDAFRSPTGIWGFDPDRIVALVVNVRFLKPAARYEGSFDQIRFDGPDTWVDPDLTFGVYRSELGSGMDADQDGVLDRYETGTGVYRGPTDTGTFGWLADSDGDGIPDGAELLAGTNPVDATDVLAFAAVERLTDSRVRLRWMARPGRRYTVYTTNERSCLEANFWPLPGARRLVVAEEGWVEVVDEVLVGEGAGYYRLAVE